ncbi:SET domain-containing protein [Pseudodesulfovibrio sp. zrk46]|uniref:SET domain-containing protein n=1 Tax=Pseudodesulfovibrio sp. zrk46 TaxID=2725288 RepID=UPI001448A7C0|nr:SET domain-containing protein [Pseudodesulfovibrio sp. zrk46]QJB58279.1 SET domain-containing protein [Pseudodesulfovibrio sp. zrk46]
MIHPHTAIQAVSPEIGLGVFATGFIPKGTIVVVRDRFDTCLSQEEFCNLEEPARSCMETYLYHDKHGNLILSWDHARFMNHSCNSNTMMTDYGLEIAIKDIEPGEEVTTEYGLLNIQDPYELCCQCCDCREELRLDDIDVHGNAWDELIRAGLTAIPQVHQPLWALLDETERKRLEAFLHGTAEYSSIKCLKWRTE